MKKEYEYNTSDDYQIESPICDINVINYHMNVMSIMPIAGLLPQFEFRESDWVRERFNSMLLHLRIDKEQDEKHIFDLASGGFSSTVRLAKSSSDMWVPILTQNRDNVLRVIDTYLEKMRQFRDAIADYDESRIDELIREANRIKKIIR